MTTNTERHEAPDTTNTECHEAPDTTNGPWHPESDADRFATFLAETVTNRTVSPFADERRQLIAAHAADLTAAHLASGSAWRTAVPIVGDALKRAPKSWTEDTARIKPSNVYPFGSAHGTVAISCANRISKGLTLVRDIVGPTGTPEALAAAWDEVTADGPAAIDKAHKARKAPNPTPNPTPTETPTEAPTEAPNPTPTEAPTPKATDGGPTAAELVKRAQNAEAATLRETQRREALERMVAEADRKARHAIELAENQAPIVAALRAALAAAYDPEANGNLVAWGENQGVKVTRSRVTMTRTQWDDLCGVVDTLHDTLTKVVAIVDGERSA